jgi:hypothetical protein
MEKTLTVPEAGHRYFGLGKNAAYAAARRGDIPTIRIGRLLRVPVVAMEWKLDAAKESCGDPHSLRRNFGRKGELKCSPIQACK